MENGSERAGALQTKSWQPGHKSVMSVPHSQCAGVTVSEWEETRELSTGVEVGIITEKRKARGGVQGT